MIYVKAAIRWYDFWVGFYYNERKKVLYFCPFTCVIFAFSKNPDLEIPT